MGPHWVPVVHQSGYGQIMVPAIPAGAGTAKLVSCRKKGAIAKVTAQSSLMSVRRLIVHRKRRPFPGGVFFNFETRNQSLSLVSILIL